jgi:hypothetical protein
MSRRGPEVHVTATGRIASAQYSVFSESITGNPYRGILTLEITAVLAVGLYPARRVVTQDPLDDWPNYRPEVGKLPLQPRWTEGRFLSGFLPENGEFDTKQHHNLLTGKHLRRFTESFAAY